MSEKNLYEKIADGAGLDRKLVKNILLGVIYNKSGFPEITEEQKTRLVQALEETPAPANMRGSLEYLAREIRGR